MSRNHIFAEKTQKPRSIKRFCLFGYPKRYKYKTPRWVLLDVDTDLNGLINIINNRYRFNTEDYVFSIVEENATYEYTTVSNEKIMLVRIKEGV